MNKEYEKLISKFYDLSCEEKKKEIYEEFEKINKVLDAVSQFSKNPSSNDIVKYDENNKDNEDENLTKIYNNLMIMEEKIIYYLKENGY